MNDRNASSAPFQKRKGERFFMMRSLSSAVAGLRSHQTRMDVIGNNIANVNTFGFKSSRTTFADVFYQTISAGRQPGPGSGGTNPTQIGYGSAVRTIDVMMTQSGMAATGRPMDVYVAGEGFLVVQDSEGNRMYTRLGVLGFDSEGQLVDHTGNLVLGWPGGTDANGQPIGAMSPIAIPDEGFTFESGRSIASIFDSIRDLTIGPRGEILGTIIDPGVPGDPTATPPVQAIPPEPHVIQIGTLALATFRNPFGLSQNGQSYFVEAPNSGPPTYNAPGNDGTGNLVSGSLEMSNVEVAREFTDMIITQRGFQANTRIITVSDEMLNELVNMRR